MLNFFNKKNYIFLLFILFCLVAFKTNLLNCKALINSILKKEDINFKIKKLKKCNDNINDFLEIAKFKFKIDLKGVIHIGASYAQEQAIYDFFGFKNILYIEADPEVFSKLQEKFNSKSNENVKIANFAASNYNGVANFFRTNNYLSSSLLKLNKHKIWFPEINLAKEIIVESKTLDKYFEEQKFNYNTENYNVMILDIQGAELLALKGSINTLKNIDLIISEVDYDELYENGAILEEIDEFLLKHNFIRIDTKTVMQAYGDAMYINKKFFK